MSDTTWNEGDQVYVPREQIPIPFFDHAVLAVRRDDGQIYLSIRDICEALELAFILETLATSPSEHDEISEKRST